MRLGIAALSAICWAVPLRSVSVPAVPSGSRPQEQAKPGKQLDVKISVAHPKVAINESLQLHVEIWNLGTQDLLVCKELISFTAPCYLKLDFQPLAKVTHHQIAVDCVPYEWLKDVPPRKIEDFANILIADWVSVAPNHFYGATIEMKPSYYPELGVPGHYRVSGSYASRGALGGPCYHKLRPFSDEVAHLPAEFWQGVAYSNSVDVYVRNKRD